MGATRLLLNSTENARKSLSRCMRKYLAGDMSRDALRDITYAFSVLLGYHKQVKEEELEVRIERLESAVESSR